MKMKYIKKILFYNRHIVNFGLLIILTSIFYFPIFNNVILHNIFVGIIAIMAFLQRCPKCKNLMTKVPPNKWMPWGGWSPIVFKNCRFCGQDLDKVPNFTEKDPPFPS